MNKLGVFDSGLGGFNVVAHLRAHLTMDIVFFADNKNLPYGLKTDEDLLVILIDNMQWFKDRGINHVLIACNTASNFIDQLREHFPDMTIDSIIEITAKQFSDEDLVIFGTNVTTRSKKYDEYLDKKHHYHALSELASLVEANDEYEIDKYLKEELKEYNGSQNYLLACTHYSIYEQVFEKYLKGNIYDSIGPINTYYKNLEGTAQLEIYTSGNIKTLRHQLKTMFGCEVLANPHLETYKIVVASDNHGMYAPVAQVIEDHPDASAFIHCGDVQLDDPIMDKFYAVNGNNDYIITYPKSIELVINDKKYYITHSDEYPRFNRYDKLFEHAKTIGADVVFYGHEHIYKELWMEDMLLLNPGSLFYNRDNTLPSYAVVTVSKSGFKIEHVEI